MDILLCPLTQQRWIPLEPLQSSNIPLVIDSTEATTRKKQKLLLAVDKIDKNSNNLLQVTFFFQNLHTKPKSDPDYMQPLDIQHYFINQQVADNPTKLCHRAPFDRQINIRITRTRLESCSSQAPMDMGLRFSFPIPSGEI